jgi:hypothetical protein
METLGEVLEAAVELGPAEGLARFAGGLDPDWIAEALAATGSASCRRRKLPATQVVWLVLGMAMFAGSSVRDVVEHLDLVVPGVRSLAPSAIPQARYRLGSDPLKWLFYRTSSAWSGAAEACVWRGLSLHGVDGSSLRVQDSDENYEYFGKPGGRNGSGDAGYPQVRIACLLNLGTRLMEAAEFGPFDRGEQDLADALWQHITDDSLTILDRGFVNFPVFAGLVSSGSNRHFMVRMRRNLKFNEVALLPDGSLLADLPCSRELRRTRPDLPPTIRGRIIGYKHPDGEASRVFTTLTDHARYPANELVALYHERWEIEIAFDEFKTHMLERKECLRSKKPDGVAQELWGALLLYNLVRNEMIRVAGERGLSPKRVSFKSSLLLMRNFWEVAAWRSRPGNVPRYLAEFRSTLDVLLLPPRRPDRRYPRHVKIKMSNYQRNRGKRPTKAIDETAGSA